MVRVDLVEQIETYIILKMTTRNILIVVIVLLVIAVVVTNLPSKWVLNKNGKWVWHEDFLRGRGKNYNKSKSRGISGYQIAYYK